MSAREPEICEITFHSLQQGLQMVRTLSFTISSKINIVLPKYGIWFKAPSGGDCSEILPGCINCFTINNKLASAGTDFNCPGELDIVQEGTPRTAPGWGTGAAKPPTGKSPGVQWTGLDMSPGGQEAVPALGWAGAGQ